MIERATGYALLIQETPFSIVKLFPQITIDYKFPKLLSEFLTTRRTSEATLGQVVHKYGEHSGSATGKVTAINVDFMTYMKPKSDKNFLDNMIEITSSTSYPFAVPGDSGAPVINENGIIGLIIASGYKGALDQSKQSAYIAPIHEVLQRLKLEAVM